MHARTHARTNLALLLQFSCDVGRRRKIGFFHAVVFEDLTALL
jgi:hypothetical protein